MPSVEVRRAVADDAAIEAWASGGSEEGVRRVLATTTAFVAVVAATVAGWANLPAHGARGVARALYDAVEREARLRRLSRLTATASLRAAPVFERFGFTELERGVRTFNAETFRVVLMAKRLPPEQHR